MAGRTTVIVGCTNRKTVAPLPEMHLRSIASGDRLREWVSRLEAAVPSISPSDLYCGEAWGQALALSRAVASAEPYVLSAGYGLVPFDAAIAPYSATLSGGQDDSVALPDDCVRQVNSAWMASLRSWPGPAPTTGPRSIVEVARSRPADPIIVCLGRTYAEAIASDLLLASRTLTDAELLMVFSSGAPLSDLEVSWVTVPGSLRLVLGGTLGSTITRAAQAVARTCDRQPLLASTARAETARLTAMSPDLPNHRRQRSSDDAVRQWIVNHLRTRPASSAWSALRTMRDQGLACEQQRFRALFEDVNG